MLKQELAAMEEEKQSIAESMPVANWTEPVRAKAVGDRTANQTFKLLRLEENWCKVHFYTKAVEDLLAYLDEEKRKLIELHYFDGYPIWGSPGVGYSGHQFLPVSGCYSYPASPQVRIVVHC